MKKRKYRYFMGDFETTVYEGQEYTEVWCSACVELYSEDVKIFHSIGEQFEYLKLLNENVVIYYHNLKFDGNFWMYYLLHDLALEQAYDDKTKSWVHEKEMKNNTFKYTISDMGQWYSICIKVSGHYIEIRDSLKLLPFSVKRIGESFGTKHKKLDMVYSGFRYAGCNITPEEKEYIANDVLVVKEALEILFNEGHKGLTIGSCCLEEFKKSYGKYDYNLFFPNLYEYQIDGMMYDASNAGEYIRRSYRGGWCYLVKGKERKIYKHGITLDVNSLYPSMMSSESKNRYPIGVPFFWKGDYIPEEASKSDRYYFIRIATRFYIKDGKLPFIQIKNNLMFKSNEMLESSEDWIDYKASKSEYYKSIKGNLVQSRIELTLTKTDYELLKDQYYLAGCEILDGCWFYTELGLFDEYILKYKKIKMESKGAKRELAKLFLNNLYGKMAASTQSNFKLAQIYEDDITFTPVTANDKVPGYIAIGSAITSYARNFTIRAAQANYYGKDKPGFIYADTDSIHCDIGISDVKGVNIDAKNFCCWKHESTWDEGYYLRQKTYIEHIVEDSGEPLEKPYYNVKCAGMPQKCKDLFIASMTGDPIQGENEAEKEFTSMRRGIQDFDYGLEVPGKLRPVRIRGGIVLKETPYKLRR